MLFFFISILAGILTVLAPCILPLLPIVIGASEKDEKRISKKSITIITSLSISVIIFTLLLKASTLFIDIPQSFWSIFSGIILIIVGLAVIFPDIWTKIPFVNKLNLASNKAVGEGYKKKNYKGDILIGLALGPVFTTCSPTYLFIIATALPATFILGLFYLIGFVLGLAISLFTIAYFGQTIINKLSSQEKSTERIKKAFGIVVMIVGLTIITGYDKKLQAYILDSGYGATIKFEERLIDNYSK
jgi:cytochrome c-type biogenesis protein